MLLAASPPPFPHCQLASLLDHHVYRESSAYPVVIVMHKLFGSLTTPTHLPRQPASQSAPHPKTQTCTIGMLHSPRLLPQAVQVQWAWPGVGQAPQCTCAHHTHTALFLVCLAINTQLAHPPLNHPTNNSPPHRPHLMHSPQSLDALELAVVHGHGWRQDQHRTCLGTQSGCRGTKGTTGDTLLNPGPTLLTYPSLHPPNISPSHSHTHAVLASDSAPALQLVMVP